MIPDCGQVPGMGTCLTTYAMSLLDEADEVTFWDGGNPLHPVPPFNYTLTFNIAGLTNEYYGVAHFLRDGKRVEVPTFLAEDYELVDFPEPIGRMEAFVAGGGTSTMPWTFEGQAQDALEQDAPLAGPLRRVEGVHGRRAARDRAGGRGRDIRRPARRPPHAAGPEAPREARRPRPRHRPRPREGPQGRASRRGRSSRSSTGWTRRPASRRWSARPAGTARSRRSSTPTA